MLKQFIARVNSEGIGMRGIVVMKDGVILDEHAWLFEERRNIHSVSKTVTSMAVGIAASEGYFSLTDRIAGYFEDKLPLNPEPSLLDITVEDLLTMSAGFESAMHEEFYYCDIDDMQKYYLSRKMKFKPGTHFDYDTGCAYMLSALVHRTTGISLREYMHKKVLSYLGILNAPWPSCLMGITIGGSALMLTTKEMALFGQLLLQKGTWNGKVLIPAEYISNAVKPHIFAYSPDSAQARGYGYQIWSDFFPEVYPDAYCARGSWGKYIIVIPSMNVVVAITAHEEIPKKLKILEQILMEEVLDRL